MSENISLASLMTPSKTVAIDFDGYPDFSVELTYLAREELVKLRKRCVTTKFNKKTHQPEEHVEEDKFLTEFSGGGSQRQSSFQHNQVRHQFNNSECGVYSMNFIIRLLHGETFEGITGNITKDTEMNACRQSYFRNN